MRFSRLVIGVLVIVATLWVIVSEQMAGASADAVLNAQIVTVRTPVAGTLRDADRALGSAVSMGDTLATVASATPDAVRLDDLILERDLAQTRLREREAQKAAADAEVARLAARVTAYRDLSVQDLSARLAEATERLRLQAAAGPGADPIATSLARQEVESLRIQL